MKQKRIFAMIISISFLLATVGCGDPSISSSSVSSTSYAQNSSSNLASKTESNRGDSDVSSTDVSSNSTVTSSRLTSSQTQSNSSRTICPEYPSSETPQISSKPAVSSEPELETKSRLPITPNYSGKSAKIAILGNSFVGSSEIGPILQLLAKENNQKLQIDDVSIGYAQIKTYYDDLSCFPNITNGYYDVIFLCGMYDTIDDQLALKGLLEKIKDTKTKIVLFPAYNESAVTINACFEYNEAVGICNWREAILSMTNHGIPLIPYLSFDDAFLHTTPVGGFIGACMIYSYLYRSHPEFSTTGMNMIARYSEYLIGDSELEKLTFLKAAEVIGYETVYGSKF